MPLEHPARLYHVAAAARVLAAGFAEMREGFSTVATGMAQITALLTNIAGPERDSS